MHQGIHLSREMTVANSKRSGNCPPRPQASQAFFDGDNGAGAGWRCAPSTQVRAAYKLATAPKMDPPADPEASSNLLLHVSPGKQDEQNKARQGKREKIGQGGQLAKGDGEARQAAGHGRKLAEGEHGAGKARPGAQRAKIDLLHYLCDLLRQLPVHRPSGCALVPYMQPLN